MTKKEERTERAVKAGYDAFVNSFNWGQSSLAGLLTEFADDLSDAEKSLLVKAASLTPGVATTGQTCGTVTGPVLFFGTMFGGDGTKTPLDPVEESQGAARTAIGVQFVKNMAKYWGGCTCKQIHGQIMGKNYELDTFDGVMKLYTEGGDTKCQRAVEVGIRQACDLLLDDDGNFTVK